MKFFHFHRAHRSCAVALAAFFAVGHVAGPVFAVGTRHFVFETAKDFEAGEAEGVFIDSVGRLRPGLHLSPFSVGEAPVVWGALKAGPGVLLATGNEGKLLSLQAGKVTTLADSEAMALTSVVEAWGRVFVGTLPGGAILEWKNGRLENFATLPEALIWGLAFDAKSNSLYAATGPKGEVYRVSSTGKADVYFDAEESHLVSVAAQGGVVYAGSSGKARLYKVTAPGRGEVLYDFGKTEVRAIVASASGSVFCVANELKGNSRSEAWKTDRPAPATSNEATKGSGELYRFGADGRAEKLFESKDDFFTTLTLVGKDQPVLGTGVEARVFQVEPRLESRQIGDLEQRQVSAIALDANLHGYIVSSDPVSFYEVAGLGTRSGSYTSPALDAGLRATFGKVRYDAGLGVEVRFRSGNTEDPGAYWSDWSAPVVNGQELKVPPARYLQFKVVMPDGPDRFLERIEIPFRTDNLMATVQKVQVESPSLPKSTKGLKSSGGPIEGTPSSKVRVSFEIDNPDEDELRYRVEYQAKGGKTWFDALEPGEVLTKNNFTWDTSNLAEGEYRLRVTASDELSNSPNEARTHMLASSLVLVDNTPPRLLGWKWSGRTLSGTAVDGVGPIRRVEIRTGGPKEWLPLSPIDGIFDQASESFQLELNPDIAVTDEFLTVRAFDAALNSTVEIVRITR
jgi:hypothetical protein